MLESILASKMENFSAYQQDNYNNAQMGTAPKADESGFFQACYAEYTREVQLKQMKDEMEMDRLLKIQRLHAAEMQFLEMQKLEKQEQMQRMVQLIAQKQESKLSPISSHAQPISLSLSEMVPKSNEVCSDKMGNGFCNFVRNAKGSGKGTWKCPVCRNHNHRGRKACNRCQLPFPGFDELNEWWDFVAAYGFDAPQTPWHLLYPENVEFPEMALAKHWMPLPVSPAKGDFVKAPVKEKPVLLLSESVCNSVANTPHLRSATPDPNFSQYNSIGRQAFPFPSFENSPKNSHAQTWDNLEASALQFQSEWEKASLKQKEEERLEEVARAMGVYDNYDEAESYESYSNYKKYNSSSYSSKAYAEEDYHFVASFEYLKRQLTHSTCVGADSQPSLPGSPALDFATPYSGCRENISLDTLASCAGFIDGVGYVPELPALTEVSEASSPSSASPSLK